MSDKKQDEAEDTATWEERCQAWQRSYHDYQRCLAHFFQWCESFQYQLHSYQEHHQSIQDAQADLERVKQELIGKQVREGRRDGFGSGNLF